MYFVLQTPSLQHLAGLKIDAALWNQRDILAQSVHTDYGNQQHVEEEVRRNATTLPIPELCKEQLIHFVKPLGQEIRDWRDYTAERNESSKLKKEPERFCWTMHGTVDYAKTAALMMNDERLNIFKRYELACVYGLEEEARELIKFISKDRRQKYMNLRISYLNRMDMHHYSITLFTHTLSNGESGEFPRSIKEFLFNETLCSGNRALCEFIFKTLNRRGRKRVLAKRHELIYSCRASPSRNVLYYLSLWNEVQREDLFSTGNYVGILTCLLNWPSQSLFMDAARLGWKLMYRQACSVVLRSIMAKMFGGFRDYDYFQLLWECWRMTPDDYRPFISNEYELSAYLWFTEEDFIKLILDKASSYQLKTSFDKIREVMLDEKAISEATLVECKQRASLHSANDSEDEEVSRLVDTAMEIRINSRKIYNHLMKKME